MSNDLDLAQVAENATGKETTINTAIGQLAAAVTDFLAVSVSSATALTDTQYRRNYVYKLTGNNVLTVPALRKASIFSNTGASDITLKRGTTEIILEAGVTAIVYTDGTANGMIGVAGAGGGSGGGVEEAPEDSKLYGRKDAAWVEIVIPEPEPGANTVYELAASVNGVMVNNETVLVNVFTKAVTFPAGLTGSQAKALTAATASTVLSVRKNGTQFGTITFAAAGTTGTFAAASSTAFAAGDILSVVGPATADTTLSGLGLALVGAL